MPPAMPPGLGGPPPPAAPAPGGGGGKKINLGVPAGAGPGPAMIAFGGAPPGGGGGEGPSLPETGGGPPGGGPPGAGGAEPGMDYPELNIAGLEDGSGLEDLPDEGHARIHYKVTDKGSHQDKKSKKKKHHASLEIHHLTPEGNGGQKESEADGIRKKAKQFFETEDQGPPGGPDQGMGSETPG